MPRKHIRLVGSRQYRDYTPETIELALQSVVDARYSLREASKKFKIPFGTLYNKYKGKHGRPPGRPTIFTKEEELAILKSAAKCSDWGFPLNLMDIRMMAKYYLDARGKTVNLFKNNIPGIDWTYSLLQRHKESYGQRLATNIKRVRAEVSRETLGKFYDNLEKTIENFPSSNIFNYDESNLSDDPGKKRGIYRRGVKYPEKVMNHSKSCTTIMVCGAADGTFLPPYVVYKSLHLYDTWRENGPRGPPCCDKPCCNLGTRFNRTTSGWMDGATFRDWFKSVFLPHAKRLNGRKALIGDNLSSHLDVDVLKMCAENEIDFICLVPNSTHLCQPLDVGFFRPMKEAWRATLSEWKLQNLRVPTVPKDTFAGLLRKSLNIMDSKPPRVVANQPRTETDNITTAIKRNLISSFRSSGIFPLDRNQVFKKLPIEAEEGDPTNEVENALTAFLKEQRFGQSNRPQRKRKRLDVEPGCSISTAAYGGDVGDTDGSGNEDPLPTTSTRNENHSAIPESTESTSDTEPELDDEETTTRSFTVGQYILGKFVSQRGKKTYKYMCKIIEVDPEIVVVGMKSIGKNKRKFRIISDDVSEIKREDIIEVHPEPTVEADDDGNLFYTFKNDIPILEV